MPGVVVRGRIGPRYAEILSRDALAFLAELHRRFDGKRRDLLVTRSERQKRFDAGELPDFPPKPAAFATSTAGVWRRNPAEPTNRRVEITGPVDRKMIVNALNSGATHYMADFEDANSPTGRTILMTRSTRRIADEVKSTLPIRTRKSATQSVRSRRY